MTKSWNAAPKSSDLRSDCLMNPRTDTTKGPRGPRNSDLTRVSQCAGTVGHRRFRDQSRTVSMPDSRERAESTVVDFERCDECGFNGEEWSDAAAISAIAGLPTRFAKAVAGLRSDDLLRRPVDDQWSIAEYADHVREVLFGMSFLVDIAVTQPGTDLGESASSPFTSEPRQIDIDAALVAIERE